MASSGKSEKLGLSLWEADDMPERLDFLQDNQQLEKLLGAHLASDVFHLTEEEKNFVSSPIHFGRYVGTGTSSVTFPYLYGHTTPRLALVWAKGWPPVTCIDGKAAIHFAVGTKSFGCSLGLTLNDGNFVLKNKDYSDNLGSYRAALNEQTDYAYIMIW